LKVAFLSYAFGKEAFGTGKYGWYLTNELRNLGVSVDVFTTNVHFKSLDPPLFYVRNLSLKLKNYSLVTEVVGVREEIGGMRCEMNERFDEMAKRYDVISEELVRTRS
jgi:hypothetical protein